MAAVALGHLRVLDLSQMIAGPYCTRLFALYGADVLKVERPVLGDCARRLDGADASIEDRERNPTFLYLNTGKRSITLDLKKPEGRDILLALANRADLIVENFCPGVMQRLGLDYDTLSAGHPELVMLSISNFGQTGPYRNYRASELTMQAWAGLMHMAGHADREPLQLGFAATQYLAGQNAFAAALGALLGEPARQGQHLDIAILDTALMGLNAAHAQYSYNQTIAGRRGQGANRASNRHPTRDGMLVGEPPSDRAGLERLAKVVGEPLPVGDRRAVAEVMSHWLAERTKAEAMSIGQGVHLAWGALNDLREIAISPHLAARGFFQQVNHWTAGPEAYAGAPFRIGGDIPPIAPAPGLGEHTREVLERSLGYSDDQIQALIANEVV